MNTDLELKSLESFTGTDSYYKVMGMLVTDGVKYIMDNGYSWFVTDAIAVVRNKFRDEPFLTIKLKVDLEEKTAVVTMDDGNGNILYRQEYLYTDAKRDLTLFCQYPVVMLNREY